MLFHKLTCKPLCTVQFTNLVANRNVDGRTFYMFRRDSTLLCLHLDLCNPESPLEPHEAAAAATLYFKVVQAFLCKSQRLCIVHSTFTLLQVSVFCQECFLKPNTSKPLCR